MKPKPSELIKGLTKKEYSKAWRESNKEQIKEYRQKNRDRILEKEREYRKRNRRKRTEQYRNLKFNGNLKYILEKYNYSCWLCRRNLKDSRQEIHHKDGKGFNEKKYGANNKISNLVLLCPKCHRRLHLLIKCYVNGG